MFKKLNLQRTRLQIAFWGFLTFKYLHINYSLRFKNEFEFK